MIWWFCVDGVRCPFLIASSFIWLCGLRVGGWWRVEGWSRLMEKGKERYWDPPIHWAIQSRFVRCTLYVWCVTRHGDYIPDNYFGLGFISSSKGEKVRNVLRWLALRLRFVSYQENDAGGRSLHMHLGGLGSFCRQSGSLLQELCYPAV